MAEKAVEEVGTTCALCLQEFYQPRKLPCGHFFCKPCLRRLPSRTEDGAQMITCPTCNVPARLPASSIPEAIMLQAKTLASIRMLRNREREIDEQAAEVERQIHQSASEAMSSIDQAEAHMQQEVRDAVRKRIDGISKKKEEAQSILDNLEHCKNYVELTLQLGSPQQIVANRQLLMDRMLELTSQARALDLQPAKTAELDFQPQLQSFTETLSSLPTQLGTVHATFAYQKCHASGAGIRKAIVGKEATFDLTVEEEDGTRANLPLSLIRCKLIGQGMTLNCDVVNTSTGLYTASYTPTSCGTYQLEVYAGNGYITGSPFTVMVVMDARSFPVRCISNLREPICVAFDRYGHIVVSEDDSHQIVVLDKDGDRICAFGSEGCNDGEFNQQWGVVVTPDNHILVVDSQNHRLQLFTMQGVFVKCIGSQGSEKDQFTSPFGIAVHPNKQVLVADWGNHRIQVLNSDLTFSHSFGTKGSDPGQFLYPYDIACDSDGVVYIADFLNHCVQKFTVVGEFLERFGVRGTGEGEIQLPVAIAVDSNDLVYVADRCRRVSVFDKEGKFLECFGSGLIGIPFGLAVGEEGHVYVCDSMNNRILVF